MPLCVVFLALCFLYRKLILKMVRRIEKICGRFFLLSGKSVDLEWMAGANQIPRTIIKGAGDLIGIQRYLFQE
jgi:hypothetical protein